MAQLAISAAGAAVGFVVGGPIGAQAGWAVGSLIGSQFGPKQKSFGPRLEELKVTGSEYGQAIPWAAGHPRLAGQVWWASDRREVATTTSQGKGGGGAESTNYTYEVDILYGLVDREIVSVSRIWLNGKLVWTTRIESDAASISASQADAPWSRLTVYTGEATQLPDPSYEAVVGAGNAPAYRGRGSVFIEGLTLGTSGVIPNLTFEVVFAGSVSDGCISTDPDELLLLCFNGNNNDAVTTSTIIDASPFARVPTAASGAELTSDYVLCGSTSLSSILSSSKIDYDQTEFPPFENDDFTIQFGFYEDSTTEGVFVGRFTEDSQGWRIRWSEGFNEIRFQNFATAGGGITTTRWDLVVPPGWNRWAFVKTATGVNFYLNGEIQSPAATPGTFAVTVPTGRRLSIGYDRTTSIAAVRGCLDEFSIIGRALSAGELMTDCNEAGIIDVEEETLQSVVEMLCAEAGMDSGTYDATALASITKPVRAFALSQVATIRSALEVLMSAYFFEAYVTDKIYFVPRAGSVADSIDVDDMGAGIDAATSDLLPTQITSKIELPPQIAVSYANVDADYTTATEQSDRLI